MRFIIHAGAGKTGSTSIQAHMLNNLDSYRESGFWYIDLPLGGSLDSQPVTPDNIESLSIEARQSFLAKGLMSIPASWNELKAIVVCREELVDRPKTLSDLVSIASRYGAEAEVVLYVRNPAEFIQSSYFQWGLKHKTYEGRIQKFSDWVGKNDIQTLEKVINIYSTFDNVHIYNYSQHFDVVRHFVKKVLRVENIGGLSFSNVRENNTPPTTELIFRAMFNDFFSNPVDPTVLDVLSSHASSLTKSLLEYDSLLPNEEDVSNYIEKHRVSIRSINQILNNDGQESLAENITLMKVGHSNINHDFLYILKLIATLYFLLYNLKSKGD